MHATGGTASVTGEAAATHPAAAHMATTTTAMPTALRPHWY